MNPRLRTALIIAGIAVAAYLGYRWWSNRQDSSGLGANLNSVAPELIGGSAGPSSGLTYNAGSTTVNLTEPVSTSTSGTQPVIRPFPPVPGPANYKPSFKIFPPIRQGG
jgi:hypothetical protein